jgi:hypothetical protein
LTKIDSFSCIGVSACVGLTYGTISKEACQGVGSCSRPYMESITSYYGRDRPSPFTVGSNSCNGCYAVSSFVS